MPVRKRYRDMAERLLYNSWLNPVTGCWEWLGATNSCGYPRVCVRIAGRPTMVLAHRVSLETFTGKRLLTGLVVDHRCRNPCCINPLHLRQVTYTTNNKRAVRNETA